MSTTSKPARKSAPVAVTPSRGRTQGNKTATIQTAQTARPAKPALPKPAATPVSKVPVKPAPVPRP